MFSRTQATVWKKIFPCFVILTLAFGLWAAGNQTKENTTYVEYGYRSPKELALHHDKGVADVTSLHRDLASITAVSRRDAGLKKEEKNLGMASLGWILVDGTTDQLVLGMTHPLVFASGEATIEKKGAAPAYTVLRTLKQGDIAKEHTITDVEKIEQAIDAPKKEYTDLEALRERLKKAQVNDLAYQSTGIHVITHPTLDPLELRERLIERFPAEMNSDIQQAYQENVVPSLVTLNKMEKALKNNDIGMLCKLGAEKRRGLCAQYQHSEQLILNYLAQKEIISAWVRDALTKMKDQSTQPPKAIFFNLHTEQEPCKTCAISLFRENQRKDGVIRRIQKEFTEQTNMELPFHVFVSSTKGLSPNDQRWKALKQYDTNHEASLMLNQVANPFFLYKNLADKKQKPAPGLPFRVVQSASSKVVESQPSVRSGEPPEKKRRVEDNQLTRIETEV